MSCKKFCITGCRGNANSRTPCSIYATRSVAVAGGKLDTKGGRWRESEDLRRLLGAFERVLPLRKPSELTQRSVVQFILAVSAGLTGEISRLLNEAAAMAILDGTERITLGHLEHVARPAQ